MTEARSRDLYSRTDELDEQTLGGIADVLELRGRHPQQVAIRAAYLDLVPDWEGQRVLEIGCATGVVSRELARRVGPDGSVLALDPSPVFLTRARKIAEPDGLRNVIFQAADARQLDLPDGEFDVVVAVTVLCHVPGREQLLQELRRVVRPGGRVLIMDGDYASNQLAHPDRALTERIIAAWRGQVVDDPWLVRRLGRLLVDAELAIEAVRGHVHVELGRVDEQASFIWQWSLFALKQALAVDAVTEGEAECWLADLRALHVEGGLFGSVNYVSVLARRP
jgi:ubiquinone/menaquinone biosynthesis C-methylase UbiE